MKKTAATIKEKKLTTKENLILADVDEAVKQIKRDKKGKIKLKTIQQVLDEL